MSPLISINIVTHNRAHYIVDAIQSVLKQSYANWELIIIDDASTDNTYEVVHPFLKDGRIKYLIVSKKDNIAQVRNIALNESIGDYIAVLDSDDKWTDVDKLKKQVSFLENNLDHALIGGAAEIIDANDNVIEIIKKPLTDEEIKKDFFSKNPFFHSSILVRANILKLMHGYDEAFSFGEDMDLCLRIGREHKLCNLSDPIVSYRRHDDNEATKHSKAAVLDVFRIIKKNRKAYNANIFIYLKKVLVKLREMVS